MRVELIRDRAERPPSRFEDGGTHRSPYTSMFSNRIVALLPVPVKLPLACRPRFSLRFCATYATFSIIEMIFLSFFKKG